MNEPQRKRTSTNNWRGAEMLLFLVASVVGIYGMGRGLSGLFEPGQGISLVWLAVTGVAFFILFAQMGRVQGTWPRRRETNTNQAHHTTHEEAEQPSVQADER
jgi:hypothetical protein